MLPVLLGGALGALARSALADAAVTTGFPWWTLVANLAGAALLGAVVTRTRQDGPWRAGLGAGLCGALTTFSTLQVELVLLLDDGRTALATAYAAASLAGGPAAYVLGRRA